MIIVNQFKIDLDKNILYLSVKLAMTGVFKIVVILIKLNVNLLLKVLIMNVLTSKL